MPCRSLNCWAFLVLRCPIQQYTFIQKRECIFDIFTDLSSDILGSASYVIMDTDYDSYALLCTCQARDIILWTLHRRSCTILQRDPVKDPEISKQVWCSQFIHRDSKTFFSFSHFTASNPVELQGARHRRRGARWPGLWHNLPPQLWLQWQWEGIADWCGQNHWRI